MPSPVADNPNLPDVSRSLALLERAKARIPCATQTLAKGPTMYGRGAAPVFLERGKGARVWDVDGNEYVDLVMALGPVSLGYAFPEVDTAIEAQLRNGISFSLVHPLEVEVAELIHELVPSAEMVRFSKTGADATSAAVRLSRAHTGRDKVVSCGYHGWHDFHAGTMPRHAGVPEVVRERSVQFPYGDLAAAADVIDEHTACVILEPVAFELPDPGFLPGLRALCDKAGALLVFDEMWTGFRLDVGGAQAYFDVRPDLSCFSKAIANGMPLSVVCGRSDVMQLCEDDIFFFTTFGGEALSLAAAKVTMEVLRDRDVPGHMRRLGLRLMEGIDAVARQHGLDYVRCHGLPCRSALSVTPPGVDAALAKSFVQQELLRRGILWSGFHALSLSHTEADIDYVVSAYGAVLPALDAAVREGDLARRLVGAPIGTSLRAPWPSPGDAP